MCNNLPTSFYLFYENNNYNKNVLPFKNLLVLVLTQDEVALDLDTTNTYIS